MPIGDVELNARGQPRKVAQHRTKAEQHAIVEEVRAMIRVGMTDGEMKRSVSAKHGIKPRCAEPYIARARKRNLEYLGASEDENLSASLAFWNRKKQESEAALQASRKEQGEIDARITKEKDAEVLEVLQRVSEGIRKKAYTAEMHSRDAQDHIDKLLGNHAPVKVASTNVNLELSGMSDEQVEEQRERLGIPRLSVEPLKLVAPVEKLPVTP